MATPNFIYANGGQAVFVPAGWTLIILPTNGGIVNLYSIPSLQVNGSKQPFVANPQINGFTSYTMPVNTGDSMIFIESLGGTVEWSVAAANPVLISSSRPYTLNRILTATGNATANSPRGRSASMLVFR
jgi:hypothetical protein